MDAEYLTVDHLSLKDLIRFFSKVEITNTCWNWMAQRDKNGYGFFKWNKDHVVVSRFIYAWLFGPIPKGRLFHVDHLCKNRRCCNPLHLELVPRKVNYERSDNPSAVNKRKTHCIKGHPFNENNTYYRTRQGIQVRDCKTCAREWREAHIEQSRASSRRYKLWIRKGIR